MLTRLLTHRSRSPEGRLPATQSAASSLEPGAALEHRACDLLDGLNPNDLGDVLLENPLNAIGERQL
jgi:hypothetical protein